MSIFSRKYRQSQGPFPESKIPEAEKKIATSNDFWKVLLNNATATARLAKAKASRKKLEFIDLRTADYCLGRKAYDAGKPLPGHEDLVSQLIEVQIGMATLEEAAGRKAATSTEKAKAAFHATATAAKVQAFRLNKSRLLMALGAQLRRAPQLDASLSAELNSAKAVSARIEALDSEIKKLECDIYTWAPRPLWKRLNLLPSTLARMGVGMTTNLSRQTENKHFLPLTIIARLKVILVKRKILSLSITGVIVCLVIFSLRSSPGPVAVPPEVWNALPEEEQKILGMLRESTSGIKLVQKLLDYGAERSHKEKVQVVDVSPLTYKTVNGKDYVAIAVKETSQGVTQRVCYVLDLKTQGYYALSSEDYNTFLASGNVQLKDSSPFSLLVLVYAMANRENPDLSTDPSILKELSPEVLAHWKSFQNPENIIKATQTAVDNSNVNIKVTGAAPLCYKRIGGEIYGLYSFTEVLNGLSKQVGFVVPYKNPQKWFLLSEEDYDYVLAYDDLSKAKRLDPSILVAQAAPVPTPELDPRMNNLAAFGDMLKQAFDITQNKQSMEQFLGNFVQDLAKMKKVPYDANEAKAYRDYQDQSAEDSRKASEDSRRQFNEGMDMIRQDDEEKAQREREQQDRDRQQQAWDEQQRRQRENN
jgi:hypothetical protein